MTEPLPWEQMTRLWRLLATATAEAAPALEEAGLQSKQFFVLSEVAANSSPTGLARATQSPPATITSALKVLEARGYVARASVAGDLRRHSITLTPAGRAALAQGVEAMDAAFGRRLAALSAGQRQAFARMIDAMLQAGREEG